MARCASCVVKAKELRRRITGEGAPANPVLHVALRLPTPPDVFAEAWSPLQHPAPDDRGWAGIHIGGSPSEPARPTNMSELIAETAEMQVATKPPVLPLGRCCQMLPIPGLAVLAVQGDSAQERARR